MSAQLRKTNTTTADCPPLQKGLWRLIPTAPNRSPYELADTTLLGRDRNCDICLSEPYLSRQHARLTIREGALWVEDLNSSNGTFVNNERIETAELKIGDRLRLDVIEYTIAAGSALEDERTKIGSKTPSVNREGTATNGIGTTPEKRWKTKPTSHGNRHATLHMQQVKRKSDWGFLLLSLLLAGSVAAALIYLITEL